MRFNIASVTPGNVVVSKKVIGDGADDLNWDFAKVHDYCYERGFTIYPGKIEKKGTFRLCSLGAIDETDIVDFWKVFKEALKKYNIQVPIVYND